MKYYYDTQARCVVSETKLLNEFYCSNADDYGNFYDCIKRWQASGNLLCIGNKPSYEKEVRQCISEDNLWRDYYKKHYKGTKRFKHIVDSVINYVFYSEFNPYLERRYRDISWLEVAEGVYLNLDDIWEEFCLQVTEV